MYQLSKDRIANFENDSTLTALELSNSRLGLGIIVAMAAFVGVWGTTCLLSGLASSGSFQELGRGLFTAITGI